MSGAGDGTGGSDGWVTVAALAGLPEGRPAAATAEGVELVLVRRGGQVAALSGRCPHRSARLAEHGEVDGELLVCCKHGWDFRLDTGAPPGGEGEGLCAFVAEVGPGGEVRLRAEELRRHALAHPEVFHDDEEVA